MSDVAVKKIDRRGLADFPEQNPNPVFRSSFRGDLLYANASALAFLAGLSPGGDAPLPDVIRPLAAKAEGTPVIEGELTDEKGRIYWYTAVRPSGQSYVNFYLREITLRKRAEEALRESEARFRALTEASPTQIAVSRITDGMILYANRSYERAFGFEPGRALGQAAPDFYVDPADRDALIGEIRKTGFLRDCEVRVKRKDGRPFWILVSAVPITFDGKDAILAASIDISGRKLAEEERERTAAQRQLALDAARMGWWHYDPATKVVSWDVRFAEIFGVTGSTLTIDEVFAQSIHPEDAVLLWAEIERSLTPPDPRPFEAEYRILRPNGAVRWIEAHGIASFEGEAESRRAVSFVGTVADVTELKAVEAELRRIRQDLDRAEEVAQIGWWRLDTRRNVLTWSDENHRIFGIPKGTPLTYEIFLGAVHPDDRAYVDERWNAGLRGEPYDIEHRILSEGRIKWVREKAYLEFDTSGGLLGGFGITQDITERKRSDALRHALAEQEKLRLGAAVEQASDAVVMVDLDGTIRYVNASFETINRAGRDQIAGRSYFELLAGDPGAAAIRDAFGKGETWHGHLTRSFGTAKPVDLEVTVSPAKDPAGTVIGWLITEKDVTLENALQRQVRQAQKMEALGTLAGGITHDFNNILGAIIINTELALLDLDPSHPARKPLPTILQAANRGKELVNQIITFSRQRTWERKPLEIVPVVQDGLKFLHSTLAKEITIHEAIEPGCGLVLADPSHIHQVLVNLCQNAALAMRGRGGALEVKLRPLDADEALAARHPDLSPGPYVHLTVADSGCGMTKDLQERIFEPFFTTRRTGEGSGLGLAVVHGIVKGYRGAITVYSEPGRGSVFNVYFPRLPEGTAAEGPAPSSQPLKGEERILLVEDEKAQRTSLAEGLERLGYRVTARAEGRTALASFRKDPRAFDLVITDQIMPRMSGLELAAELAKIQPDLPVILCTGFSEKINGGVVGKAGIRELVMKPFTLREITRLIRKIMD